MNARPLPAELLDLLADRATQGLTAAETARADALFLAANAADDDALDLAAAALDLAMTSVERMPADVRSRLMSAEGVTPRRPDAVRPDTVARIGPQTGSTTRVWASLGWLAAAACLALAALGWLRSASPHAVTTTEQSVLAHRDAVRWDWKPAAEDSKLAGIEGRVVFSAEAQAGVLKLKNLPAIDPAKQQYQLWIVDPDRKQPVDGGVFDAVAAGPDGEISIPINAKLQVAKPALFAITIERRGGVVVSDGPIAAVAAPSKS